MCVCSAGSHRDHFYRSWNFPADYLLKHLRVCEEFCACFFRFERPQYETTWYGKPGRKRAPTSVGSSKTCLFVVRTTLDAAWSRFISDCATKPVDSATIVLTTTDKINRTKTRFSGRWDSFDCVLYVSQMIYNSSGIALEDVSNLVQRVASLEKAKNKFQFPHQQSRENLHELRSMAAEQDWKFKAARRHC